MRPAIHHSTRLLLTLILLLLALFLNSGGPLSAAYQVESPEAGTVAGTVFRDFDDDGTLDANEPGLAGVTVNGIDNLGNTRTATTAANGTYTLSPSMAGSTVRVEFILPAAMSYLQPGLAGGTSVQFVSIAAGNATGINAGFFNPGDYYGFTPRLATTIFRKEENTGDTLSTLDEYAYTADGTFGSVPVTKVAEADDTGTVYGVAYQRQTDRIYLSSYIRRGASLGSTESTGAIYRVTNHDYTTGALLVDINGVNGIDTGVNPHPAPLSSAQWSVDVNTYAVVGKRGMGDLDIAENGLTLYTTNLNQRTLVIIPFQPDMVTVNVPGIMQIPIPADSDCSGDPIRPFGLKFQDGLLYVGAVCTAETTNVITNLRAYVFVFNPITLTFNSSPLLEFSLNYPRRHINDNFTPLAYTNTADGEWRPWNDTWRPTGCYGSAGCGGGTLWGYPQPMLSDIEFDGQGWMMLGFRDRLADQAYYTGDPGPINGTTDSTRHGGDILLACLVSGVWQLENAGTCNGRTTGDPDSGGTAAANYGSGPGNREFYYMDHFDLSYTPDYHRDLGLGALAILPGSGEVVHTIYDTHATQDGGTLILNNNNGSRARAVQLLPPGAEFGKAGGTGDVELVGANPGIEIGNRVWQDTDNDGVQDPGESPISGVTVTIHDQAGTQLASTTTNANGLYYFNNLNTSGTVAVRVNTSADDAEQRTDTGDTTVTSTDLEPVNDNNSSATPYAVGVRFTNLGIPAGATITSAYIQFTSDDSVVNSAGTATFTVEGQCIADAPTFAAGTANFDITGRTRTIADVTWSTPSWGTPGVAGADQRTADLSTIVQEIVGTGNLCGSWALGNDMAFIITGANTHHREAESYDGVNTSAPLLVINYTYSPANYANLAYNTAYQLRVSTSQSALLGLSVAKPDNDTTTNGDLRDSDGQPEAAGYTAINFTTGMAGANNHTYDFAFVPSTSLGDRVFNDRNNNGTYDPPVRIGDYVWYDRNNNGQQDAGEPGVGGVRVELHRSTDADCNAAALASAVTDSTGQYLFDNLSAGNNYFVCFRLATIPVGFTPTTADSGSDTTDSDANVTTGRTANTGVLAAGTQSLTWDMGLISSGSVAIGDRVWYDLNSDGDQDTNENIGVPGVRVELHLSTDADCNATPFAVTVTNALGLYLFAGLPAGTYYVCFDLASLPAGHTVTTIDLGGNDTLDSDANTTTGRTANTPAMAANSANMTFDMGIVSAVNNVLGNFVWFDRDRDGVQDANESGVSGVRVELHLTGTTCADIPLAVTRTGQTGQYSFTRLANGSYFVCFILSTLPTGYQVTTQGAGPGSGTATDSDANATTGQTPSATLTGGATNNDFDMGIRRTDAGTVAVGDRAWLDINRDGVQDAGEPGVPYIQAELYVNGQTCGTNVPTAVTSTDSNGYYLFTGLPANNYFVCFRVSTPSLPAGGYEVTTINAGGNDLTDSDANITTGVTAATGALAAGESDHTLDLGIRTTVLPANQVSVGNFVWFDHNGDGDQDAGESGVAGVLVTVYHASSNRPIATMPTDAAGNYLFTGLPSASYYVIFDLSTIPAGFSVTTQDVGVDTADSDANTTTGQTAATGVIAAGGSNITLDMGIRPAGTVRVGDRVWHDIDRDGRQDPTEPGVPGVTVYLQRAGNSCSSTPLGSAITNLDGYYVFANLAPGSYFVCFDLTTLPTGYQTTASNNQVDDAVDSDTAATPGQTAHTGNLAAGQVDMTLDLGIYATGNVSVGNYVWFDNNVNGLQESGEGGVAGAIVQLYRNGQTCNREMPLAVATTGADGSYLFTGLPTGSYFTCLDLTSLPTGYQLTTADAGGDTLDSDGNTTTGATSNTANLTANQSDITLDFGVRQTAGGTVAVGDYVWYDDDRDGIQDANERGVPGITVELHPATNADCNAAPATTTTTNSNGFYLFSALAAGVDRYVCFDLTTLPAGYVVTVQDSASTTDGLDSDANPVTGANGGRTANTGALTAGQVNRSLDMGIYAPNHDVVLPNVTIQLYAAAQACDGSSFLFQVTTDANGNYVFPNLPAGDYYVHIPASNFTTGQAAEYMISSTGNDPAPDPDVNTSNTDDNGTAVVGGSCNGGVSSANVTLSPNTEPTGDGSTDPNTPDASHNLTADFGLFEPLCIGDLVWFDADNSGAVNGAEYGLNGILLNLYRDVNGNGIFEPGAADGSAIANTTTANVGGVDGSYSFCTVAAGSYFIQIPSTEFQAGDLLFQFDSSTANNNPETTTTENDDNGTDGGDAGTNGISSVAAVALAVRSEPTADNNTNDNGRRDSSTNQTVDLGIFSAVQMDYGDLPTSYNNTIFGENGPRHVSSGLMMGSTWDADPDGQESTTAAGDDSELPDDEDGAVRNGGWTDGANGGRVTVTVSANACLNAWIDWTNNSNTPNTPDGDFNDTGERVIANVQVVTGANNLTFNVPAGTFNGLGGSRIFNMRFRLTPRDAGNVCTLASAYAGGGGASPTGLATGGEVEDYQWTFEPTAVSLQHVDIALTQPALLVTVVVILLGLFTTLIALRRRPLSR